MDQKRLAEQSFNWLHKGKVFCLDVCILRVLAVVGLVAIVVHAVVAAAMAVVTVAVVVAERIVIIIILVRVSFSFIASITTAMMNLLDL